MVSTKDQSNDFGLVLEIKLLVNVSVTKMQPVT